MKSTSKYLQPTFATLFSLAAAAASAQGTRGAGQVPVPPRDPDIRTVGRWDKSAPGTFRSHWDGAYLRVGFTGTSVGVRLAAGTSLWVSIDGELGREVKAQSGVNDLARAPLAAGRHTLLVGGLGQNEELEFQGLLLDAGASTWALPPRPLVEFVGDSITTGKGYAWLVGEALGTDHVQIAFSGRALTSGFGCGDDKAGLDAQYFQLKNFNHLQEPPAPWGFSYAPQAIVINLGQNDQCGSEPDATLTASYARFVRAIRARFPQAHIMALRPFGGAYEGAERAAIAQVVASGDKRVSFVDTSGWLEKGDLRDGVHPTERGHAKVSRRLAPLLRARLAPQAAAASAATVAAVGFPSNPASLAQELQNAYNAGARRIVIRPGKYLLPATGKTAFALDGWRDVTISARGVTLVMQDHKWGLNLFGLDGCENVTLEGATLSQTMIPFYQGKVLSVGQEGGKSYADWKPDAVYPTPPAGSAKFPSGLNVVDAATRLLKAGNGDWWSPPMEARPGGAWRIRFDQPALKFGAGDWIVGRHGEMGFKVWLNNARNCTLRDLTLLRNGFSPIREEGFGGGNRVLGVRWALGPRPEGATEAPLVSGAADGLHSTGASPGPRIEGCVFEGVILDDCIAIHGSFQKIVKVDGATLVVENGWAGLKVGEPARLSDEKGFFGEATVTALRDNGDKTSTVVLSQVLGVPAEAKLSNPRAAGAGFAIIGNRLGNTRSRGILTKSDDGVFQDNVITGCGMAAISIGPEYYWNEADYSQRLVIEGNTLRGNGKSGWGGGAILIHGDGAMGNRDITIRNNRFEGNTFGDIDAQWVEGLSILGNTMSGPAAWPAGTPRSPITLANSRRVVLRGNAVTNPKAYAPEIVASGDNVSDLRREDAAAQPQ